MSKNGKIKFKTRNPTGIKRQDRPFFFTNGMRLDPVASGPTPGVATGRGRHSKDMRHRLRTALEHNGWSVREVSDVREALNQVWLGVPRLVLLDLTMPMMDGFSFLDRLRVLPGCAEVSVVVLSARDVTAQARDRQSEVDGVLHTGDSSIQERREGDTGRKTRRVRCSPLTEQTAVFERDVLRPAKSSTPHGLLAVRVRAECTRMDLSIRPPSLTRYDTLNAAVRLRATGFSVSPKRNGRRTAVNASGCE